MSNVINFPVSDRRDAIRSHRHVGAAFLADPTPQSHAVQFYEDEHFLVETVAEFLGSGLRAGDRVVVIATGAHRDAFVERIEASEIDVGAAVANGQLTLLDAERTLERFMVGDAPDPDLFHDLLRRTLAKMRDGHADRRVRAYGEMVDFLWRKGNSRAALRLEEFWNDAGKEHAFELLCAYSMGNFYNEGDAQRFLEVCRNHSHVIPTEVFSQLDDPHARLREISLLQQRAHALESEIQHRKQLEAALRDALRARSDIEDELRAYVQRERVARARAEESDQFKEVILGILGHDLRNPLNTILTTTQLMMLRDELAGDNKRRLDRMFASGMRMKRMIDQLLDVTRARLADGILITKTQEHDVVAVVQKIADELRAANPGRTVEVRASAPCPAFVDADRLEQVVSNLVGNALSHGDPSTEVEVDVVTRANVVSIAVLNFGPPIDPTLMPILFDPFKRGEQPYKRSAGLGLGLYISDRIVRAHGGTLEVVSSAEAGTRFEVVLPRR